jgi:site-specific recombinase XerD
MPKTRNLPKRLTPAGVAALRPKPVRYEIGDGGSALRVVVHPTGRKTWIMRYRRPSDGKQAKLTLGPVSNFADETSEPVIGAPLTLVGAQKLVALALHEKALGRDPGAQRKSAATAKMPTARTETLGDVLPDYVSHLVVKNRSFAPTVRALTGLVKPWMERELKSITPDDCWRLIGDARTHGMGLPMRCTGPSESRARLAQFCLGGLFRWCVRQRRIAASPMAGLAPPQPIVDRERVLEEPEIAILWRALDVLGPWHAACIRLLLTTGQRLNEIAKLRHDEIREDAIELAKTRTKNKRPHTVPLSGLAREVLDAVPRVEGCGYVFSSGRSPVGGWSNVKRRLVAEMRRLGWNCAPFVIHDLRRTCASHLARLGTRIHVTEKILNHVSGTMRGLVGVYQRYSYRDEMREALERWAVEIARITGENVVRLDERRVATDGVVAQPRLPGGQPRSAIAASSNSKGSRR